MNSYFDPEMKEVAGIARGGESWREHGGELEAPGKLGQGEKEDEGRERISCIRSYVYRMKRAVFETVGKFTLVQLPSPPSFVSLARLSTIVRLDRSAMPFVATEYRPPFGFQRVLTFGSGSLPRGGNCCHATRTETMQSNLIIDV